MSKFTQYLEELNQDVEILDEAEKKYVKGSDLSPEQQAEAKRRFVHRFTGNNKPEWSKQIWKDGKPYPQHFKDDKDWLANTEFAVNKKGELHAGTKYCNSSPTYPNNPELRKTVKESINEKQVDPILEGNKLIDMLMLKKDKSGKVKTSWGDKTPEGLYKSLETFFK